MEWQTVKRTRVMVIDTDWTLGIKIADWLAVHGYQPVLHRSYDAAVAELNTIRPQAVIIAVDSHTIPEQTNVSQSLSRLQSVSPEIPVITIADTATEYMTPFSDHYGVHLLKKPVNFNEIDHLLKSERCLSTV